VPYKKRAVLSWSSGKDSAWALRLLRQTQELEVVALVTTFDRSADRIARPAVRRTLVEAQAQRINSPLWAIDLPPEDSEHSG
jgi:diphthamide synthase (EF-2-diphthine--ammonia ligase)